MFSVRHGRLACVLPAVLHCVISQSFAAGLPVKLERTLFSDLPTSHGSFGFSLNEFDGDLLVAEPWRQRVHLYSLPSASLSTTFVSPDASTTAVSFGRVMTEWNGNVVIADFESNATAVRSGSAYLFDPAGNYLATFSNPVPGSWSNFGYSAESVGERVFLTARAGEGFVYGYDSAEENPILKIRNPQFFPDGHFGIELEAFDDSLFVGAPLNQSGSVAYSGMAYRFNAQSGALELSIGHPEPGDNGKFGWAMDVSEGRLLVGAPGLSVEGANHSGAAYLFDASTGELLRTLRNPVPRDSASFGESVEIVGDSAFVAAPGAYVDNIFHAGVIYQFDLPSGQLVGEFHSPRPEHNGWFGRSGGAQNGGLLAIGDRLIVGDASRSATGGIANAGAAVIYVVPEPSTLGLLASTVILLVCVLPLHMTASTSTTRSGR